MTESPATQRIIDLVQVLNVSRRELERELEWALDFIGSMPATNSGNSVERYAEALFHLKVSKEFSNAGRFPPANKLINDAKS